ncbi:extracellular solute-binding protein family 1 [Paenibacillus curdlanolyticus YK9]|uniref:Extracellular solute-binding protein family 1 n=1 Tax=Paenibacillus curdlanolyticus YK9 TaxID=717606 RepID=E0I4J0_9BACL|nr:extracellular solute-binding protein [Paenibacillus curdlanolyticus]EFM12521.1 extracellular solute-binding protein family 1 [Paenibacillus curdlanolyticus YK9]
MLKRFQYVLLLSVIGYVCAGCSSAEDTPPSSERSDAFEPYPTPVALRVGIGIDPNFRSDQGETPINNVWTRALKESLNIETQAAWQVVNPNLDQKVNLAIATNELPDALVVNRGQFNQMIEADEIADLTDAYHKFASPVMKKIIDSTNGLSENNVIIDGKIMAIPSIDAEDMSMLWIRKDWLDELGLKPPQTMEELERVAEAFVTKDPDRNGEADTIGITAGQTIFDDIRVGPSAFTFDPIFSAHHAYPGFWLQGSDGKPVYGSILPETKAALSKLRDLYARGLIDKDMGAYESDAEPVIQGKAGIFFAPFFVGYWPLPDALRNNPRANWQAYALPLDAGEKFNAKVFHYSKSFLVVRKGYEHPEAAIKVLSLALRDENKYGIDFQPLRQVLAPRDEISYSVKALREVLDGTKTPEDYADGIEYKLLYHDLQAIRTTKLAPFANTDIQYWNTQDPNFSRAYALLVGGRNLLDPHVHRMASMSNDISPSMENLWVNLSEMERYVFKKIIMGAAPLSAFDDFVSDWKAQGGDLLTADKANHSRQ